MPPLCLLGGAWAIFPPNYRIAGLVLSVCYDQATLGRGTELLDPFGDSLLTFFRVSQEQNLEASKLWRPWLPS